MENSEKLAELITLSNKLCHIIGAAMDISEYIHEQQQITVTGVHIHGTLTILHDMAAQIRELAEDVSLGGRGNG